MHRGAFEQLVCPGRGTFANIFSKNVYALESARQGWKGGGIMGTLGID